MCTSQVEDLSYILSYQTQQTDKKIKKLLSLNEAQENLWRMCASSGYPVKVEVIFETLYLRVMYQSETIYENKNVSYEAHLCPIIVKAQRAPNAQATLQIVD